VYAGVRHQTFFLGNREETAMCDAGLFGARHGGEFPGIEVRIKMNDRNRPVDLVQGAEDRKNNRVVAAESAA